MTESKNEYQLPDGLELVRGFRPTEEIKGANGQVIYEAGEIVVRKGDLEITLKITRKLIDVMNLRPEE